MWLGAPWSPQATLLGSSLEHCHPLDSLPSKHFPLNRTFCSSLNFVISCSEEKFSSLDTALHFKIFFGTLAVNKPNTNVFSTNQPGGVRIGGGRGESVPVAKATF